MKIETILNAYDISYARYCYVPEFDESKFGRRMRQHRAFRARILRMDAEKDARIVELEGHNYALNLYIEETEMGSEKSLVKGREQ